MDWMWMRKDGIADAAKVTRESFVMHHAGVGWEECEDPAVTAALTAEVEARVAELAEDPPDSGAEETTTARASRRTASPKE